MIDMSGLWSERAFPANLSCIVIFWWGLDLIQTATCTSQYNYDAHITRVEDLLPFHFSNHRLVTIRDPI